MNTLIKGVIISTIALLAPQLMQAQGTVYVSNLGQPSTGSEAVGSDSWLAAGFITGNNPGGYLLDSIQLAMADAAGSPSGFTAMLYNNNNIALFLPGSSLGTLDGSTDPATSGNYVYTPASNLILSPHTTYMIVLTAGTTVANGAYEWSVTGLNSYNGWVGQQFVRYSNDGSSWSLPSFSGVNAQFAVNATAIPEPSAVSLILLGSGVLIYARRNHKSKARTVP